MYLTRLTLDRQNSLKMKHAAHAAAIHSHIENSFPEEKNRGERTRKLWRIDPIDGVHYLLIVSDSIPDPRALESLAEAGSVETKDYEPFLDRLQDGTRARFRVKLNPVMASREGKKTGERGRIVPVADDDQLDYFLTRAEANGFSVEADQCAVVERGTELFRKAGQRDLHLKKAVYEGLLTVTDAPRFRRLLTEGMGKKKAYGFGLMTVIPLP